MPHDCNSPQAPSHPPGHSRPLLHKSRRFPAKPECPDRVAPATSTGSRPATENEVCLRQDPWGSSPSCRPGGEEGGTMPTPARPSVWSGPDASSSAAPGPGRSSSLPPARSRPGVRSSLWSRSDPHRSPRSRGDPRGSSPSRCGPLPAAPPGPIPLHAALPDPARSLGLPRVRSRSDPMAPPIRSLSQSWSHSRGASRSPRLPRVPAAEAYALPPAARGTTVHRGVLPAAPLWSRSLPGR